MDPALRRAWTCVVTPEDYDRHMAAVGQSQAAAELSRDLIDSASLRSGGHIVITGAGTGQMFDYLSPAVFRPYRLTCTDLNPVFLAHLRTRLDRCGLAAAIVADDIERSALNLRPDLLLATLLLEHIDWRRGVEAIASLHPRACAIILQENPPEMLTAVTPGRLLPPSIAAAVEFAHPVLVPRDALIIAMSGRGYQCRESLVREVADAKRLVGLLFPIELCLPG